MTNRMIFSLGFCVNAFILGMNLLINGPTNPGAGFSLFAMLMFLFLLINTWDENKEG